MREARVSPDLLIRRGTAADTDQILKLVKLSLGEGAIPRDRLYWNWKHHENPFGESPILLAESEGELVGLRVFMRWDWKSGSQTIRAVRAVDTATHPDWRGRGIFSRLTLALVEQVREEGVHLVFNTPNDQSRPGYLKMGWRAVGRTDLWIRPQRPISIARALLSRFRGSAEQNSQPVVHDGQLAGEVLSAKSNLASALLSESERGADDRLSVHRDYEYLHWRYVSIPGITYLAMAEVDRGEGAVVIYRLKKQGMLNEIRVCDIVAGPGKHSRKIARALLSRLRGSDGDYVSAMAASGTAEKRILLGAGFLPAPRLGPILTVLPLNQLPGAADPLQRNSWRPTIGDMELF
ncbi:hypothetical protein BH23GEM6_BH23GEM6_18150 [soil metagenome]